VEFYSKNKSEKLVHLVGFIIRTYSVYLLANNDPAYTRGYQFRIRTKAGKKVAKIKAAFHTPSSPMARCNLHMTNNNTPQNFTSQTKDMKQHITQCACADTTVTALPLHSV